MSFEVIDQTPYGSNPIELFEFNSIEENVTTSFYYTSSDTSFYDGTRLWAAMPMDHDEFEISALLERVGLTINVTQDHPVARLFLNPNPPTPIAIRLYQQHRNDSERQTIFVGTVKTCSFEDEEARIHCESVQTAIKKVGLQRAHSRTCNHVLYDATTCKAVSSGFLSTGFISSIQNNYQRLIMTFTPDRPSEWFTTGEVIRPVGQRISILSHTLSGGIHTVDLIRPFPGLSTAEAVTVTAGCKRTYDVCQAKFNNAVNYGGFPFIPVVNPFETSFFN